MGHRKTRRLRLPTKGVSCRAPSRPRESEVSLRIPGEQPTHHELHDIVRIREHEIECIDSVRVDRLSTLELSADRGDQSQPIYGQAATLTRIRQPAPVKYMHQGYIWTQEADPGSEYRGCIEFSRSSFSSDENPIQGVEAILRLVVTGVAE